MQCFKSLAEVARWPIAIFDVPEVSCTVINQRHTHIKWHGANLPWQRVTLGNLLLLSAWQSATRGLANKTAFLDLVAMPISNIMGSLAIVAHQLQLLQVSASAMGLGPGLPSRQDDSRFRTLSIRLDLKIIRNFQAVIGYAIKPS